MVELEDRIGGSGSQESGRVESHVANRVDTLRNSFFLSFTIPGRNLLRFNTWMCPTSMSLSSFPPSRSDLRERPPVAPVTFTDLSPTELRPFFRFHSDLVSA